MTAIPNHTDFVIEPRETYNTPANMQRFAGVFCKPSQQQHKSGSLPPVQREAAQSHTQIGLRLTERW